MKALRFASSNPHKLRELIAIFAGSGLELRALDAARDVPPEPEEDGETFAENARLKARYYARALGEVCLAEDSGLVVDALGGAPGVRSARYAETGATRDERDRANNEKLLRELADVPEAARTARFVCALAVASPDGAIQAEATGSFEGRIARVARGTNGFGYDPLLLLPELGRTSAELSPAEKDLRSHRGAAARALLPRLLALGARDE